MKNVGNSSRGRSQGVPKIFRAPMYRAHCAVIFAIAQLSCYRGANAIFGTLGRIASEEVVLHLIERKCLPLLLFGLEV